MSDSARECVKNCSTGFLKKKHIKYKLENLTLRQKVSQLLKDQQFCMQTSFYYTYNWATKERFSNLLSKKIKSENFEKS